MPPFLILDRSAGEIATMAARNKCLARNNKSGIGEGAGPIRRESGGTPMNPFRGRDRARHPFIGRSCQGT